GGGYSAPHHPLAAHRRRLVGHEPRRPDARQRRTPPAQGLSGGEERDGVTNRLWLIPVLGAIAAPLVTWLPVLAFYFPWAGMPRYGESSKPGWVHPSAAGIDIMHIGLFWLMLFVLIGCLVGRSDRWLGLALVAMGVEVFLFAGVTSGFHAIVFMCGALTLWAVRQLPEQYKPRVVLALAASGIFQAVYMIQQRLDYDLFWAFGGPQHSHFK